jgi:hypothetical protein
MRVEVLPGDCWGGAEAAGEAGGGGAGEGTRPKAAGAKALGGSIEFPGGTRM